MNGEIALTNNKIRIQEGHIKSHLGDKGELWFAASLPDGWVWQPPRRDFGKDGLIVIRDGSKLHNLEFTFQIKTSARHKIKNNVVTLSGVSRSSVQYWFASPIPTLIVAYDTGRKTAWYVWHTDAFRNPRELFGSKSKTISIKIPTKNVLAGNGWRNLRSDIDGYYNSLKRALHTDAQLNQLMLSINNIARTVSNLMKIGARSVPDKPFTKDEGILIMTEQIDLKLLIESIRAILTWIPKDIRQYKSVEFWLESFTTIALSSWPNLMNLPPYGSDIDPDCDFSFYPHLVRENRPKLVVAMVDLLVLLTRTEAGEVSIPD